MVLRSICRTWSTDDLFKEEDMAQSAAQWAKELQADPCISFWLKEALATLLNRDPLDAERDAELLHRVMQRHLSEIL